MLTGTHMRQPAAMRVGGREEVAADAVWLVHTLVTGFFLVAWALPWRWALWSTAVGSPIVQVQWLVNDDLCVLTTLERRLRGVAHVAPDGQQSFLGDLVRRLTGRAPTDACVNRVTYAVLWGGAFVAAIRLAMT